MKFNKDIAEKHLNELLKSNKIKVEKYSVTSCGYANWSTRSIKIPKPTNTDRFCVALHEVKHIIDGNKGKRFEQEFYADKYAMDQAKSLGFDTSDWEKRMKWHSLSRIAMAHNRGLSLSKVNDEIKSFFSEVDWSKWEGKKVFVGATYNKRGSAKPYEISYY